MEIQDFSAYQILHEINLGHWKPQKLTFWPLKQLWIFGFWILGHFQVWVGEKFLNFHTAQYGIHYYDQKGVISGQYGCFSKKLAKIGYFHKSRFESSIEEKISFSYIWLVFGKIRVDIFIISHFMKSHFSKVSWNQTFALNKIVNHWYVLKLQGRENSSSLELDFSKFCSDLK